MTCILHPLFREPAPFHDYINLCEDSSMHEDFTLPSAANMADWLDDKPAKRLTRDANPQDILDALRHGQTHLLSGEKIATLQIRDDIEFLSLLPLTREILSEAGLLPWRA